jgi:hypothetical protein
MNWQTGGVNSNYRSAKFEEISPKKTGDISRESFAFFRSHNIRRRIGIRQDRYLSMREIRKILTFSFERAQITKAFVLSARAIVKL